LSIQIRIWYPIFNIWSNTDGSRSRKTNSVSTRIRSAVTSFSSLSYPLGKKRSYSGDGKEWSSGAGSCNSMKAASNGNGWRERELGGGERDSTSMVRRRRRRTEDRRPPFGVGLGMHAAARAPLAVNSNVPSVPS